MNEPIRCYRDLIVWKAAMQLVVDCYKLAAFFPSDERFALMSQLKRAAVSVPANIAEGHGLASRKDYLRHLSIANGSLAEVETHIEIALRLEFVTVDKAAKAREQATEVSRLLYGLRKALKQPQRSDS